MKHYWKYVRQFDIFGARKVMYSDSLFLPTTLSESLKLYYKVKKGGPYFPTIEIMRNMFYCCKKIFRLFKFIMKNEKLYNSRCFPLILLQVQQMARYIALILYQKSRFIHISSYHELWYPSRNIPGHCGCELIKTAVLSGWMLLELRVLRGSLCCRKVYQKSISCACISVLEDAFSASLDVVCRRVNRQGIYHPSHMK